ncbi:HAD family hydrolase [Lachnospiraceae bacterium C1.1]|nr:HAD hydrolase-like protein [Lachnospiraceae bacterium C1.1]
MNNYKAALFDMDGTLFNTKRGIVKALRMAIEEYGLEPLKESEEEQFIGPPIQKTVESFYKISEERAIECADLFRKYYREKDFVIECDLYDGMTDCLKKLKDNGVKLGIASLKKEDMVLRICDTYNITGYFDSIHGTDARDNLSKSDIIHICMNESGISENSEAVMIGDTRFDAMGAEEAGVPFLGVTYGFGFHSAEDVNAYKNIGAAASPMSITEFFINN